ncbi:Na+/H+ antiporter subunit E [Actinomyces sp. B33]|uniref:Na+/H+ antiporter subunit E n=1 Tax=Actinomyces sp. B33 TaxID=2942131 RepID=UPI0023422CB2|nr:Na+/H+ antiporter subunit E [Actinomyces sp. B33]MDC4233468.1 Na+/H+ antiporter subunit E [Actinomyces sp. B33]
MRRLRPAGAARPAGATRGPSRVDMRPSAAMTLWLLGVWLLLLRDVSPLGVVGGLLIALAVHLLLPMPRTGTRWRIRPGALAWLLIRFLVDLVHSGLEVSWIILSGRRVRTGIVRVDLHSNDPVHLTIMSAMTSLVPGSIVVAIMRDQARMYLHVLDLDGHGGRAGIRRSALRQEERILRAIAPADVLADLGIPTRDHPIRWVRRRLPTSRPLPGDPGHDLSPSAPREGG